MRATPAPNWRPPQSPRTNHILWLIEHHPEAEVFRIAPSMTSMAPSGTDLNTQEAYDRARSLWISHADHSPVNTTILTHAALALAASDSPTALELVRRARATEPNDPKWTNWLARSYAHAVRLTFALGQIRYYAGTANSDGLPWFALPLPMSQRLTTELETSTDVSLLRATGDTLVGETKLLRSLLGSNGVTTEIVNSEAFGEHLLRRARELDRQ